MVISKEVVTLCNDINNLCKELVEEANLENNLVRIIYLDLRVDTLSQKILDRIKKNSCKEEEIEILNQQLVVLKAERALIRDIERNVKDINKIKKLIVERKLLIGAELP